MRALRFVLALGAAEAFLRRGHHVQNVLSEGGPEPSNSTTYFYREALLDHFDTASRSKMWAQRYYVDERYWCGASCPIFLYIGGEGPQGPPTDRLFMATLAQKMGALMIAVEHRFYGESRPTADMSVASLRFLSSEQALADLARFVAYVSAYAPAAGDAASSPPLRLPASPSASKWVTFGGSYPGALSAWFKLKYPAAVSGAVSSSAPVHAQFNFLSYAEVVGTALSSEAIGGSGACFAAVAAATSALMKLVRATPKAGTDPRIPSALRPCAPGISTELDLAFYESSVYSPFQEAVQYNREIPGAATVATACAVLTNSSLSAEPLERLAAVQVLFAPPADPKSPPPPPLCLQSSFERDYADEINNATWGDGGSNAARLWTWQSCNEFGYFQTTKGPPAGRPAVAHPFEALTDNGIDEAGAAVCHAAFGSGGGRAPPATGATNTHYGGRRYFGENVTIVNGNLDPWHALSVVEPSDPYWQSCLDANGDVLAPGSAPCAAQHTQPSATVVLIDTTSHCGDMYMPGLFLTKRYCPGPACHADPPSLVRAHAQIEKNVRRYVGGCEARPM